MEEELIIEIKRLLQEAETLNERPATIEFYQTLLNYHIACLDTLACDVMYSNQQAFERLSQKEKNSDE
jgi:hypothetical protein